MRPMITRKQPAATKPARQPFAQGHQGDQGDDADNQPEGGRTPETLVSKSGSSLPSRRWAMKATRESTRPRWPTPQRADGAASGQAVWPPGRGGPRPEDGPTQQELPRIPPPVSEVAVEAVPEDESGGGDGDPGKGRLAG